MKLKSVFMISITGEILLSLFCLWALMSSLGSKNYWGFMFIVPLVMSAFFAIYIINDYKKLYKFPKAKVKNE